MSAQQPGNISETRINKHTELIDVNGMQAIKSMYADKAIETIDRLGRMDEGVRDTLLHVIKGAHNAMKQSNTSAVAEVLKI